MQHEQFHDNSRKKAVVVNSLPSLHISHMDNVLVKNLFVCDTTVYGVYLNSKKAHKNETREIEGE